MNPLELARPEIRGMRPYSSARMEASEGSTWLNANESPWPPFDDGCAWNRYPQPQPAGLVTRLAALYGVPPECALVGRGSDEGIDLLVRAFCRPDEDAILISPPTFGMYATCARVQGAKVSEIPLSHDFTLDVAALLASATPSVKLVFVCAPNNPTGTGAVRSDVLHLADALGGRALLVVDEAYVEFVQPRGKYSSLADGVGKIENLVVLRTLSKAWALAGVRIGTLLADARVVALLRAIMPPYPLPTPCVEAALRALSDAGQRAMRARTTIIRNERARLRRALAELRCVREVLPSEANFLAVRFVDADLAYRSLVRAGVIVRDVRRYPMLHDALRFTLGKPEENDRVLAVLRALPAASRIPSASTEQRGLPA